eukprot:1983104-Pyramimonas_sp.AAC.1
MDTELRHSSTTSPSSRRVWHTDNATVQARSAVLFATGGVGAWSCSWALESRAAPLCDHALARPKSYFFALLKSSDFVAKGVKSIEHFQKYGYYRCLPSQSAGDLKAALEQLALATRNN